MQFRIRTGIVVFTSIGLFTAPAAWAVPITQVPYVDVNVNAQSLGAAPQADVGAVDVFDGVTVDDVQAGMTGHTIKFTRVTDLPRLLVTPLGEPFAAGRRQFSFLLNYDQIGNGGASVTESFEIRFVSSNVSNNILSLLVAGNGVNAGQLGVLVGAGQTLTPFSLNAVHALVVSLNADTKVLSVTLGGVPVVTNVAWPAGVTDLAFIDMLLTTRAPAQNVTSGVAHVDSLFMVDPNNALQEWFGTAGDLKWDTSSNWIPRAVPTVGTVFIRQPTNGDILGPSTPTILSGLLLSSGTSVKASLLLAANMNVAGLNLNAGGRILVPTGTALHVTTDWALAGELRMQGGALTGASFSNSTGGVISGFGTINSTLVSNAPGAVIRADADKTLLFATGTINDQGMLDCNGGTVELAAGVALLKSGSEDTKLNGGKLRSPTNLQITTVNGRLDGPGILEVAGVFHTALPAARMNLTAVDVVVTGPTSFEALNVDAGKHGHSLTGLANVLNSLRVGANVLTLVDMFHNDGASAEAALYVKNLDLTGTTQDAVGGRVYYENLTGGANTFANYVPIQNVAPNGTITSPSAGQSIQAGQSVAFAGSGVDPDNSAGGLTYHWSFGGGSGIADSTAQNPGNVTFATAGTFTVTLTVTDGEGLADATPDTRSITVAAVVPVIPNPIPQPQPQPEPQPEPQPTPQPAAQVAPNLCGTCGPLSPAFSLGFVASYGGLLLRRKRRLGRR